MANNETYLRNALTKYEYSDFALHDILKALSSYNDLRPNMSPFVFNDGSRRELLVLDGTIPVAYKGNTYNIPVAISLLETHPCHPPMVYVKPTSTMQIKPSKHVDANGKVYLPYLHDWRYPSSDLLGLIQILVVVFAEESPVFRSTNQQMTSPAGPGKVNVISQGRGSGTAKDETYLKHALSKYMYSEKSNTDICNAIGSFTDLRPYMSPCVFNDGSSRDLLSLNGTIPVPYKGNTYNIPVAIWLLETHPCKPPIVYVKPTSTMQIKPGRHVDENGKVYLPYLHDWSYPQSDLLGLLQILLIIFSEEPPVYNRSSAFQSTLSNCGQGQGSGQTSYQGYPFLVTDYPSCVSQEGSEIRVTNNSSRSTSEGTQLRVEDYSRRTSEGTQIRVEDSSRRTSEGTQMRVEDSLRRASEGTQIKITDN